MDFTGLIPDECSDIVVRVVYQDHDKDVMGAVQSSGCLGEYLTPQALVRLTGSADQIRAGVAAVGRCPGVRSVAQATPAECEYMTRGWVGL